MGPRRSRRGALFFWAYAIRYIPGMSEEAKPTIEEVANWYDDSSTAAEGLKGAKLVYACYETGNYEGSWIVVYVKDGVWYLDSGGHCSCNGPEWGSGGSVTTPEALESEGETVAAAVRAFIESEKE